jgi:hypothetical protein
MVNLSLPKLPNQILMVQVQGSPVSYLYMDRFSEFAVCHLRRKGIELCPSRSLRRVGKPRDNVGTLFLRARIRRQREQSIIIP